MKQFSTYFLTAMVLLFFFGGNLFSSETVEKTHVTFQSLYDFESVSDPQLSPDGKQILFGSRKSDIETNGSLSCLWLMDVDGKNKKQISPEGKSAWQARWVDQGKRIAYLSVSKEGVQVFAYDTASGTVKQITDYASGVDNYLWSPTGKGLAFVTTVYPGDHSLDYYLKRSAQKSPHTGLLYDKLLYRPYSRWDDGTITHVFYFNFADGSVTDVTPGDDYAPTSHLGGDMDLSFSADGATLAFTMNTDPVKAISTNNDIFTAKITGTDRKRISTGKGNDNDPRFSPDGNYFMYLEMVTPGYEADQKDIILMDLKKDTRRNLTADLDLPVGEFFWSSNSRYIYFVCLEKAYHVLFRIDVRSGKRVRVLENHCFSDVNVDAAGKNIYLIKSTLEQPGELFRYNVKAKTFTQLTHFSDEFVKTHKLSTCETFWYTGALNDQVMGIISFPPDFDKSKKYPLVFLIHGGPEGDWRHSYTNYVINHHLMGSRGYITVKLNIHGAGSYGLAFQKAILGNWGIVDVEDVMKGLDYLLKTYPCIDEKRVAAMGRSYGGFLVNYLNGVTDRFKCFISVDGIFDQVMSYYATDELWFMESEFLGTPTDSPEVYRRSSPMTYVDKFKTPTLVIHGGLDYRVDISQGLGMYTALKRKGVPAQLLVFPDEPHYFRKLQTWKYVNEVRFKWLERWFEQD